MTETQHGSGSAVIFTCLLPAFQTEEREREKRKEGGGGDKQAE